MKTHELFGVLIRALGVWEIATGLRFLPNLIRAIGPWRNDSEFFYEILSSAVSMSGVSLIVGCFLFFAADWLTRWTYPGTYTPEGEGGSQV